MEKTIYFGGSIHTLEPGPRPEALLVADGRIAAVGTKSEILLEQDAGTSLVDLEGGCLLPAFIDSHSHITALAATMGSVSLEGADCEEEIGRRIKDHCEKHRVKPGQWVTAFGYDNHQLQEKRHPRKDVLDKAAPHNPVVVTHASGHMGVVNGAGLAALGVDENTPDPEGGRIGRAEDGRPNGYLEEAAFTRTASKIPRPSKEERMAQLAEAQRVYLSHGITTIQDGLTDPQGWSDLRDAASAGKLLADVAAFPDLTAYPELLEDYPAYGGAYRGHLKMGGCKALLDGSPQGCTVWMTKPYLPLAGSYDGGYTGYPLHTDQEVEAYLTLALDRNMQILLHCNGDATADQFLRVYAAVREKRPGAPDIRPVMIHAQLVRPDQLSELKRLGIIPSFFVGHTWYWGDVHLRHYGWERAAHISPAGSALREGIPFTLHQDTPVAPPDMLFTLWCAVRRKTQAGAILDSNEALTPLEALRAMTAAGAYQYFEEGEKGTLRPGKKADMVILDRDPLDLPVDEIPAIVVRRTVKEGKTVFEG